LLKKEYATYGTIIFNSTMFDLSLTYFANYLGTSSVPKRVNV